MTNGDSGPMLSKHHPAIKEYTKIPKRPINEYTPFSNPLVPLAKFLANIESIEIYSMMLATTTRVLIA
jgi:hypothetical protein